jgi:hypothetical protein
MNNLLLTIKRYTVFILIVKRRREKATADPSTTLRMTDLRGCQP